MKKILIIVCLCTLLSGCTEIEEYRNSVGVKNANEIIKGIKNEYFLNQTTIPINTPLDVTTFSNSRQKIKSGTYTILSGEATNDISLIRIDNTVIDDRICSGTINDMKCTKYEEK